MKYFVLSDIPFQYRLKLTFFDKLRILFMSDIRIRFIQEDATDF